MPGDVVKLEGSALPACEVVELQGREAMNELSEWTLEVLTSKPIDPEKALRSAATLRVVDGDEGTERFTHAVIISLVDEGFQRDGRRYLLMLAPPAWLLTLREGYRVFVDKSTQEIVEQVLAEGGIPEAAVKWRLAGTYLRRPHCVQYGETDWGFITRLLADEGIAFWFEATEDGPLLVLGDDPGSHDGIEGDGVIPFEDASGLVARRHFFHLEIEDRETIEAVHVRDFDIRHPDILVEGKAGKGALEVFEYPANVLTRDAAQRRAKVRLEQLQRDARVAVGKSDCVRLQPGRVLSIEGCADDAGNARFLVVEVEHDYRRPTPNDPNARPYRNATRMVPAAKTYRPHVRHDAPRIPGVETAITTGPAGEEIHVDDLGRVKLRFMWDRSGVGDARSSGWARCVQMNMGGSMLLPRVGWEVPVAYFHGDPDRPLVLGRTYNANQVVPYGLPAAAATTTLQSATSPGGGSTNEIRMSDTAGSQEMFIHATKDQTVSVGGNATTKIGGNETHDVGLSHAVGVGGSHAHSVGGSQNVNVGTAHALSVKGARSENIGGSEEIGTVLDRGVSTGSYTELVAGSYALRCNQMNSKVSGALTELVGGSLGMVAGLGTGEHVAAARTELVGGSRTINAGKYAEQCSGAKNVTAGSASDAAGAGVITFANAGGSLTAASATISAGGPVLISAPSMTVDVGGSINAGPMTIGGGALKAKSGTTKVKGTIKRQGESKIE